jgi:hypothetical protein
MWLTFQKGEAEWIAGFLMNEAEHLNSPADGEI